MIGRLTRTLTFGKRFRMTIRMASMRSNLCIVGMAVHIMHLYVSGMLKVLGHIALMVLTVLMGEYGEIIVQPYLNI